MLTIKRYANRKLYDTAAKRYVTLSGVAALIRQGAALRVVEHTSGEDITDQVQAQILYETQKRTGRRLPAGLLIKLILAGSRGLRALRQTLTAEDGRSMVDAEIARRVAALTERQVLSLAEGQRLLDLLIGAEAPAPQAAVAEVERLIRKRGLPSLAEFARLSSQVDCLQAEVDAIVRGRGPG